MYFAEDFESMDEMAADSSDVNPLGDSLVDDVEETEDCALDTKEEGGLAGLEGDEDEEFTDFGEEEKAKAISPVTWDVDVHANQDDDNISVIASLHKNKLQHFQS